MTPLRLLRPLLPMAVLALTLPTPADAQVLSDQVLPANTYLHLSVRNVDTTRQQFEESPVGQLINDPAMDAFRAELEQAFGSDLQEGLAEVQDKLGVSVEELCNIPSGEVSVSIASAGNHVGLVIHVDFGDSESQVQALLDLATQQLDQVPELAVTRDSFDGTEITLYEVQEQVPTPLVKEFGWFIRDTHLVISSSRNVMESLLSNWGGGGESLATSNETYQFVFGQLESEPGSADVRFYLDLIGLLNKLNTSGSFGQAQFYAAMALGNLPLTGFDQLKAVAMTAEEGADDIQFRSRGMIYAETPPRSLMRVFTADSVNAVPPSWVKEDAVFYVGTRWKIGEAYQAIEELVDGFQGPGTLAALIDSASESGPGVHIKEDILDQLTGELRLVGGDMNDAIGSNEFLIALGLNNPSEFQDVLVRVSEEPGFPGEAREFQGHTLYEFTEDGMMAGATVAHGCLIIAIGEQIMEQTLRASDDVRPLSESDDFLKVSQHFPSDVVAVNFSRPAEQYRSLYELLQSGEAQDQFPGMDEIFARIDFTTLPPYDVIAKYLAPTGGYTTATENGYQSETFSLKP